VNQVLGCFPLSPFGQLPKREANPRLILHGHQLDDFNSTTLVRLAEAE
jgi:hypothetical protein